MALLIAGGVLLCIAIALDLIFRSRMAEVGNWAAFFKGGAFTTANIIACEFSGAGLLGRCI